MAQADDPLLGTVLNERYRIIAPIGHGGAGRVYRALQEKLDRHVAVKVVRSDLPERARAEMEARFFREAALAGKLSHPNIVTVHDYGTTGDGTQFVVMELLQGRTVKDAMDAGRVDPLEACRLAEGIARGLAHAHEHGLVHRDVKSSNVFLVRDIEGKERPMLLDFGLVKSQDDQSLTRTGTYMGTPLYMSPEQASGEQVDHRADIYSLGCLLYKMLTGEFPYQGESAIATSMKHVNDPLPPMASHGVKVHPDLEAIVRKTLEKKRERRYQTAAELATALERWRSKQIAEIPEEKKRGWMALIGGMGVLALLALAVGVAGVAVAAAVAVFGLTGGFSGGTTPLAVAPPDDPPSVAEGAVVDDTEPADEPDTDGATDTDAAVDAPPSQPGPVEAPPVEPPVKVVARPVAPPKPPPTRPVPAPPATKTPGTVDIDGVLFTEAEAAATLAWLNQADAAALASAGVWDKGVDVIEKNRPYASLEAFGGTRWIGTKTVQSVKDAALR